MSHNSSFLWLAICNWLLEHLRHTHHGSWVWLTKIWWFLTISHHEVRFFSHASEQIWIWLHMNKFKQIGLVGFLIVNASIVYAERGSRVLQLVWLIYISCWLKCQGYTLTLPWQIFCVVSTVTVCFHLGFWTWATARWHHKLASVIFWCRWGNYAHISEVVSDCSV